MERHWPLLLKPAAHLPLPQCLQPARRPHMFLTLPCCSPAAPAVPAPAVPAPAVQAARVAHHSPALLRLLCPPAVPAVQPARRPTSSQSTAARCSSSTAETSCAHPRSCRRVDAYSSACAVLSAWAVLAGVCGGCGLPSVLHCACDVARRRCCVLHVCAAGPWASVLPSLPYYGSRCLAHTSRLQQGGS